MDEQKQKLIERIKQAQNILVTVSANPSVDQLSAAIGLTLALNKLDKHGTAVFSGNIPSTIEFLKPEETLEKNTDSLRDFIIALDKSKADKLRYKVEDQVVRIFITPYKTSLSENDLEFSQGDFNVDVVIALGVTEQQDLDAAITAHGRILHDATVASVSTVGQGSLGTINWIDPNASSLSEMMASLTDGLDKKVMDGQIATAYLTGIVASTDRFRNEKTSPKTMSASAALMAAGANQQLIATELETAPAMPEPYVNKPVSSGIAAGGDQPQAPKAEPGTLEIEHEDNEPSPEQAPPITPEAETPNEPDRPQIQVDENGQLLMGTPDESLPEISHVRGVGTDGEPTGAGNTEVKHDRMVEPPKLGDVDLTANVNPEADDPSTEELTLPAMSPPLLSHTETVLNAEPAAVEPTAATNPTFIPQAPLPPPPPLPASPMSTPSSAPAPLPEPPAPVAPTSTPPATSVASPGTTSTQIEKPVDSPHIDTDGAPTSTQPVVPAAPGADVNDARSAVQAALNSAAPAAELAQPIAALNAQPLGPDLHAAPAPAQPVLTSFGTPLSTIVPNPGFNEPTPGNTPADDTLDMPLPSNPFGPGQAPAPQAPPSAFPGAPLNTAGTPPPPVPPPMLPPLQ